MSGEHGRIKIVIAIRLRMKIVGKHQKRIAYFEMRKSGELSKRLQ